MLRSRHGRRLEAWAIGAYSSDLVSAPKGADSDLGSAP
jgi:hypothetical protein